MRDAAAFAGPRGRGLAGVGASRATGRRSAARLGGAEVIYDWAGGLLWVLAPEDFDVRAALAGMPGHATLVRAERRRQGAAGACSIPSRRRSRRSRRACGRGSTRRAMLNPGRMGGAAAEGGLMQTNFTPEQLADPATARSNKILRTCVHCGFCTATCPTYQVLGDELD